MDKMRIYWTNILWNYTVRYYCLIQYYLRGLDKSLWKSFFYPHKRFSNSSQKEEMITGFKKEFIKFMEDIYKGQYYD